ncbi:zinc knuckle CX2CX4HX4C containing protein [Tanacetum coccineum]
MMLNVAIVLKKWSPNVSLAKEELTKVPVWVKLHNVPLVSFNHDVLSMIATKLVKPTMSDSYTSFMCLESWGQGSFAHALIELDATCGLNDMLVVAIPMSKGSGYIMETIHSVEQKKKGCNLEIQGKHQGSKSNKPINGSYRLVVKPKSTTLVSISFSSLEEDHGNYVDDLVDDTRKKVEAPSRKNGIWSDWKVERNIDFSFEIEIHYFERDGLEFVNLDHVVEVAEHGNVPSEHG